MIWEDMCQTYFFRNYGKQICYADTDIPLKNSYNPQREGEDKIRVGNFSTSISDGTNFWRQWIYSTESDLSDSDNEDKILKWHELLTIEFNLNSRHTFLTEEFKEHQNSVDLKNKYDDEIKKSQLLRKFLRPDLVLRDNNFNLEIIDYKDVPLEFYLYPSSLSPKEHNKYTHDIIKQLTYELTLQQNHKILINKFFIPFYYESLTVNNFLGEIDSSLNIKNIRIFKANFSLIQNEYLQENL